MPSVRFELTPEEWEAAQLAHLEQTRLNRPELRSFLVILVVVFGLGGALGFLVDGLFGTLPWLVGGLVGGTQFKRFARFLHRYAVRRMAKEGLTHGMFGPHEISIDEDGLRDVTPYTDLRLKWPAIDRVVESEGNFLIYSGTHSLTIIPASAFRDADELRAFGAAFFEHASRVPHLGPAGGAGGGERTGEDGRELIRRRDGS